MAPPTASLVRCCNVWQRVHRKGLGARRAIWFWPAFADRHILQMGCARGWSAVGHGMLSVAAAQLHMQPHHTVACLCAPKLGPPDSSVRSAGYLPEQAGMSLELAQRGSPPKIELGSGFRHYGVAVKDVAGVKEQAQARGLEAYDGEGFEAGLTLVKVCSMDGSPCCCIPQVLGKMRLHALRGEVHGWHRASAGRPSTQHELRENGINTSWRCGLHWSPPGGAASAGDRACTCPGSLQARDVTSPRTHLPGCQQCEHVGLSRDIVVAKLMHGGLNCLCCASPVQ